MHVDQHGTISLQNLMNTWGYQQGLEDNEVLDAIHQNMFYAFPGPNGARLLRFGLTADASGELLITVHKKGSGGNRWEDSRTWSSWKERGSWQSGWWESRETEPRQKWTVKEEEPDPPELYCGSVSSWRGTKDAAQQQWRKTPAAQTTPAPPRPVARTSGRSGQGASGAAAKEKGSTKSHEEKVSKWLRWLLKEKHQDHGLSMDEEGWVSLDTVTGIARTSFPDLHIGDAESLRNWLEDGGGGGQFEVDDDERVRLVEAEPVGLVRSYARALHDAA